MQISNIGILPFVAGLSEANNRAVQCLDSPATDSSNKLQPMRTAMRANYIEDHGTLTRLYKPQSKKERAKTKRLVKKAVAA